MKKYVFTFLMLLSFLSAKSQFQGDELEVLEFYNRTKVEIDPSLKSEFDSVFPDVTFLVKGRLSPEKTWLFAIQNNDTAYIENYNFYPLQFYCAYTSDSLIKYSNDAVTYSYILFDLIRRQGSGFRIHKFLPKKSNFSLDQTYRVTSGKDKYIRMDTTRRFINMTATVIPDSAIEIFSCGSFNKIVKIEYELQIIHKVVWGVVATFYSSDGEKFIENYRNINKVNLKFQEERYREIRNDLKKNKSSKTSTVHHLGLEQVNLDYQNTPVTNT